MSLLAELPPASFIDYLPLLLANMAAGLFLLAAYWWRGLDEPNQKTWSAGFLMPGLVAFLCGLHMIWTWPLPGPYNVAYGETSVLLGVLFLGAALATLVGGGLRNLGVYALVAGLVGVLVGARIIAANLTLSPLVSGAGFILTGLGGVLAWPIFACPQHKILRRLGALVLVAAGLLWAVTAGKAYWDHMAGFAAWVPATVARFAK